jgi:hypothetical protein
LADRVLAPAEWFDVFRELGYWPRPVSRGTKACHARDWQLPDTELAPTALENFRRLAEHGLGLLMGSPFPDGTTIGALDIDRDEYTRLGQALLRDPPCGRIGKKGAVFFVRVRGEPRNLEFRVTGDDERRWGKVCECLFVKKMCVIPPTVHPDTGQPYRWIGMPLHEIDFRLLPLVDMENG